jgi:secretory phospholipase A2
MFARRPHSRFSRSSLLLLWLAVLFVSSVEAQNRGGANIDLSDLLGGLGGLSGGSNNRGGNTKGGGTNTCSSHCEEHGTHPAPKHRIRPYANGCSVPPMLRDSIGDYRHFTQCCDLHDTCYMTCGMTKEWCDADFGKCMKRTCSATRRNNNNNDALKQCTSMADMFVLGVSMFGCDGYTGYQQEGCDCLPSSQATKRVYQYATEFYAAYNGTQSLPDHIVSKYELDSNKYSDRQGKFLYNLYRKYPDSIDVISRDGLSQRSGPAYFEKSQVHNNEL